MNKVKGLALSLSLVLGVAGLVGQTPTWQWAVSAGGTGSDEGYDVATDNQGNQYVTGRFEGTASFGTFTITAVGLFDIFIAVPIGQYFQRIIYNLGNWTHVDEGIEVSEFAYSHQPENWEGERRYVVVRQEIKKRPKASGKQLSLFKDEDYGKEYRHSLFVTNNQTASPHDIWCYYRPRANVENIIENLKDGFGLSAYNMKNFWATEAVLMSICLVLHNLVTVLVKQVLHTSDRERKLRTIRMEYLVIPALMGKNGREDVLRLGLSDPKRQTKFVEVLARLKDLRLTFYCNAVDEEGAA